MTPIIVPKAFTTKQCEDIISFRSVWIESIGSVYDDSRVYRDDGKGDQSTYSWIDSAMRDCIIYSPTLTEHIPNWLIKKVSELISPVNKKEYNFDLGKAELELILLRYNLGGHFETHTDIGPISAKRKISFTLILNDSYEGGKLKIFGMKEIPNPEIGDMILFPSYLDHKVEPVTSGVRWVLVGWILGDKQFK